MVSFTPPPPPVLPAKLRLWLKAMLFRISGGTGLKNIFKTVPPVFHKG
jgi:hypothetical protein